MVELANQYFNSIKSTLNNVERPNIELVLNELLKAYNNNRNIFIIGNGGSAATASHFVCDLNKGVTYGVVKRFRAISLSDNVPSMMAYANDINYKSIFVEQLKNFANEGDVVIGISSSGKSDNVIEAFKYANMMNLITISFTGFAGGNLKPISRINLNVPTNDIQIIEDCHSIICHMFMRMLIDKLKS